MPLLIVSRTIGVFFVDKQLSCQSSCRALSNGQIQNMMFTFCVDTITQEPNETFTLALNPLVQTTPRVGLFFRNTIQVMVVNGDSTE